LPLLRPIPIDRLIPIEDLLRELAKQIPQEGWDKHPHDLNANLDHYLYETPKK
jgi:hypothetical protein